MNSNDLYDATGEKRWYVAHTYSGYENKVKTNLEKIVENRGLHDMIVDIRVPVETYTDETGKEIEEKVYPSYVLVRRKCRKYCEVSEISAALQALWDPARSRRL